MKGLRFKLVTRDVDPDRPIQSGIAAHRATNQLYNLSADPNEQDNLLHEGKLTSGQARLSVDAIYNHLSSSLKAHIEATRIGVLSRPQSKNDLDSKTGMNELKYEIISRISMEDGLYSTEVQQEGSESERVRRNSRGDWLKID